MFDSLKKKLSGWFQKPEKEVAVEPIEKEVEKKETKPKEEKKAEKEVEEKKVEKIKEREETPEVEEKVEEEPEKIVEEEKEETEKDETPKAELKEELEPEESGFFSRLKKKLSTSELKQGEFDDIFEELEMALLENNVALGVVDKIKEELGKDLVGVSLKKKDIESTIVDSLKKAINSVLVEEEDLIEKIKKSLETPYIILFFGINGSGKTTSVAKLAWKLKQEGIDCVIAAGDTFRAASIEQLEEHGKRIGVEVIKSKYGGDPAAVAFDAISYAKKKKKKVVLIDTAGRMYTKSNLMKEMEKIVRVSKPNLKIFVGESITGNDATEQAKMFNDVAGIDGIILTKADVDEKAGAVLSVSHVTGKPILFLGVGQEYKDLEKFSKEKVLRGLGLTE